MPNFLGIDHPLIAVRDIEDAVRKYSQLGFTMTPVTRHPWGTSTSAAIMNQSLVELMSIYDESLIDLMPAGDFRFGRYVRDQLAEREGISLLALYSADAEADAATVESRGIACQGTINFGRDVTLPDGGKDRTATTLKILQDPRLPRLSNFICQQHRPSLIYVPKWMSHANGATGFAQITILAEPSVQAVVRDRLTGLYGTGCISNVPGGFAAKTGQGFFVVHGRAEIEKLYGRLPAGLAAERKPCYVAMHVAVRDLAKVADDLERSRIGFAEFENRICLGDPASFSNVFVNFVGGAPALPV